MAQSSEQVTSGIKKSNLDIKKEALDRSKIELKKETASFDKGVNDLAELQEKNIKAGDLLNKEAQSIAERGPLAKAGYRMIAIVGGDFDGVAETNNIKNAAEVLSDSKLQAIDQQKALVKQHTKLVEKESNFNNAERRYLNAEKKAIETEKKTEETNLEALEEEKKAKQDKKQSTKAVDKNIAASTAKIEALDKQKAENAKAQADNRNNKREVANTAAVPCPLVCEATKLVVTCKHQNKQRKAKIAPGKSIAELHVISASSKADKEYVDIIYASIEGGCGKGKTTVSPSMAIPGLLQRDEEGAHCPYAIVSGGNPATNVKLPGTTGTPLQVYVYSPEVEHNYLKPSWLEFFQYMFLPDSESSSKYSIETKGCDGSYDGLVTEVYAHTRASWEGEVSLGWEHTKPEPSKSVPEGTEADLEKATQAKWGITGKISGVYDYTSYSSSATLDDDFFPGLRKCMGAFSTFLNRIDLDGDEAEADTSKNAKASKDIVSFSVIYPSITIGGKYENKEDDKGHMVDTEFGITLKLDPLIGVKADLDILQALLNIAANAIAPGSLQAGKKFASFIRKVIAKVDKHKRRDKTAAEIEEDKNSPNSFSFDAAIVLTIEGNVSAELTWTKEFAGEALAEAKALPAKPELGLKDPKGSFGGGASAAIKVQLKGDIKGDVKHTNKWFVVNASLGAGFNLGAAEGGSASQFAYKMKPDIIDNKPAIGGYFDFNGLTLYYMKYATASIKSSENQDAGQSKSIRSKGGDLDLPEANPKSDESSSSGIPLKEDENTAAWAIIPAERFPSEGYNSSIILSDNVVKP